VLRPRRFWYWVAGAIAVAGVAVSIAVFTGLIGSLFETLTGPLTPLNTPDDTTIELESGSERTIYRQTRDAAGPVRSAPGARIACSVARVGGGPIEVGDAFDWTLERNTDRYEALFDFEATEAGQYRVSCTDRAQPSRRIPLAIGETLGLLELLGGIGAALGSLFGGLVIGAVIATVTAVRRDSHKRRLQHEAAQRAAAGSAS